MTKSFLFQFFHFTLPIGIFSNAKSGSMSAIEEKPNAAEWRYQAGDEFLQNQTRTVTRHDSLSKTIRQGTLEGGRRRRRQRKCWMDNVKGWTSLSKPELPKMTSRKKKKKERKRVSAESFLVSPRDDLVGRGSEMKSNQVSGFVCLSPRCRGILN